MIISEEHDRFVVVAGTFKKLVEQLACEEKPGMNTMYSSVSPIESYRLSSCEEKPGMNTMYSSVSPIESYTLSSWALTMYPGCKGVLI